MFQVPKEPVYHLDSLMNFRKPKENEVSTRKAGALKIADFNPSIALA